MPHPYQAICTVPKGAESDSEDVVIAALGSQILSIRSKTGKITTRWSAAQVTAKPEAKAETDTELRGKKRKHGQQDPIPASVIKLHAVIGQRQFIAVTGDDKCLRVFNVSDDGSISQASERCMPKRPCAIATDPEGKTIFCCDKFGDVYSLPLHYDPASNDTTGKEETPVPEKLYKPAASSKTVHTQRNRRALEEQMKAKGQKITTKEGPSFEHQLLLGHVSMLTDMVYATTKINGNQAPYLITADRDEHIRVTRGPPQTHVIERFCLGHGEYVSKVCLVPGTNWLISGGGDNWLGVWDWTTGELLAKHSVDPSLDTVIRDGMSLKSGETDEIAISGLHVLPVHDDAKRMCMLVTLEQQNFALLYDCGKLLDSSVRPTIKSSIEDGVILDVTAVGTTIVASLDTRKTSQQSIQRLKAYNIVQGSAGPLLEDAQEASWLAEINETGLQDSVDDKALDSLLYSIKNLRKRDTDDANDEA